MNQVQFLSEIGIWDWNMQTDETQWYGNMFNLYGITEEEFTGKGSDYFEFTHPSDRQIQLDNISRAVEKTISEAQITGKLSRVKPDPNEFRLIKKNGEICWVKGDAVTIVNEKNEPVSMLGILMDITQQKQLESQLLQAQKFEPIGLMTGGLIHEINNYLFTIQAYAELTQYEVKDSEAVNENLEKIRSTIASASKLLKQGLKFGKIISSEVIDFDPIPVIEEIIDLVKASARSNINFVAHLEPSENLIQANPNQLQQVGINLMNNSIHALENRNDGEIQIDLKDIRCENCPSTLCSAFRVPNQIIGCKMFKVKDNGVGMSDEIKNKAFEPFFTTKKSGTGLGLAIVKSIISDNNGIIEIKTKPNQGTQFTIFFPLIKGDEFTEDTNKETIIDKSSNFTIHIIDDWKLLTAAYARYFESEGFIIETSNTMKDGLRKISNDVDNIDLIITDYDMPDGSGFDIIKEVRKTHSELPIIMLTGYVTIPEYSDTNRELHNVKLLRKPIELGKLVFEIKNMLTKK